MQGGNHCWGIWANPGTDGNSCEPWDKGDGLIYPMNWQRPRRLTDVRDGLSHTLLIGEDVWNPEMAARGRELVLYGKGFAWAHPVEACLTCAIPPNARRPDGGAFPVADWQNTHGFKSRHAGGVQFAVADGSVHFVADTIPLGLYRALATIRGREVAAVP